MRIITIALAVALFVTIPTFAADPPGFAIWRAADLKAHDTGLSAHVADDHSSRETLAEYGDHRFRMLYRDADGNPEQHDTLIDIVFVQSGSGVLQMGGTMAGKRTTAAGERAPISCRMSPSVRRGTDEDDGDGDDMAKPPDLEANANTTTQDRVARIFLRGPARRSSNLVFACTCKSVITASRTGLGNCLMRSRIRSSVGVISAQNSIP